VVFPAGARSLSPPPGARLVGAAGRQAIVSATVEASSTAPHSGGVISASDMIVAVPTTPEPRDDAEFSTPVANTSCLSSNGTLVCVV
jgi:hypothetical protein